MGAAARAISELLASGITKSELAARSGVSRSLIDDYLKGRRQPTVAQLERLGAAASRRLAITWRPVDAGRTPQWARPNPAMASPPTTMAERAQILQRVTAAAAALGRKPLGELEFPPFHALRSRRSR